MNLPDIMQRADAAFRRFTQGASRSSQDDPRRRTMVSGAPIVGANTSRQAVQAPAPSLPLLMRLGQQGERNIREAAGSLQGVRPGDFGRALAVGLDRTGQAIGTGLDAVGLDRAGQAMRQYYQGREQESLAAMSPAMQRERAKEMVVVDPATGQYNPGKGFTSLPKIISMGAEAAPNAAVGAAVGAGTTSAIQRAGAPKWIAKMISDAFQRGEQRAAR